MYVYTLHAKTKHMYTSVRACLPPDILVSVYWTVSYEIICLRLYILLAFEIPSEAARQIFSDEETPAAAS